MANLRFWKFSKNTLPTRLYWVLFPIEDLRQAVETVQASSTTFMNIKDGYISKKGAFYMQESLDDKIDKLT